MTRPIQLFLTALVLCPAYAESLVVKDLVRITPAGTSGPVTVKVTFNPAPPAPNKIVIVAESLMGKNLNPSALVAAAGSTKTFLFTFDQPAPGDDLRQVCFRTDDGTTFAPNCLTFTTLADAIKKLDLVAKPQEKKNIFASGMVTSASSGSTGAFDVNLNSNDLGVDNLTAFLQVKRSTASGADPKNFEAGIAYSGGKALAGVDTLTAILTDLAIKTEGTATKFAVNNVVGDFSTSLQSMVLKLGPSGRAKFRFVGGIEGGSNQGKGEIPVGRAFDPLRNVDWIVRGKIGTQATLRYNRRTSQTLPFQSLELNVAGVSRHLFRNELQYTAGTDKVDRVVTGWRPWAQIDLKLMLAENEKGRYGLKLTYQNGSLPPVFANTRAIQFGIVYESNDKTGN
jgi:hypothetical protein